MSDRRRRQQTQHFLKRVTPHGPPGYGHAGASLSSIAASAPPAAPHACSHKARRVSERWRPLRLPARGRPGVLSNARTSALNHTASGLGCPSVLTIRNDLPCMANAQYASPAPPLLSLRQPSRPRFRTAACAGGIRTPARSGVTRAVSRCTKLWPKTRPVSCERQMLSVVEHDIGGYNQQAVCPLRWISRCRPGQRLLRMPELG